MLLHALHAITYITCITSITLNYMLLHTLHVIACITSITLNYMGEISLFGGVAIGHKTLKGVQRVYAWPFPKRLFRVNCNHQDFVFV